MIIDIKNEILQKLVINYFIFRLNKNNKSINNMPIISLGMINNYT